jgi:hypothetical protein
MNDVLKPDLNHIGNTGEPIMREPHLNTLSGCGRLIEKQWASLLTPL